VAVNDITDAKTLAHLLKYDSVLGTFKEDVQRPTIRSSSTARRSASWRERGWEAPWKDLGVTVVIESTGKYTKRPEVIQHIEKGGASKVIVSARDRPGRDPRPGGQRKDLRPGQAPRLSNASCTTNCLAPVVKVLHDGFGVERGFMTTIHSYTNDQRSSTRRTRTCAGPAPPPCPRSDDDRRGQGRRPGHAELKGKIDGFAVRVRPERLHRSISSLSSRKTPRSTSSTPPKAAATGPLKGILGVTDEPLVSCRFMGNPTRASCDLLSTKVNRRHLAKVIA